MYNFFFDPAYKGCHTLFLLCLTDFTQYDDLKVHPCCCRCQPLTVWLGPRLVFAESACLLGQVGHVSQEVLILSPLGVPSAACIPTLLPQLQSPPVRPSGSSPLSFRVSPLSFRVFPSLLQGLPLSALTERRQYVFEDFLVSQDVGRDFGRNASFCQ